MHMNDIYACNVPLTDFYANLCEYLQYNTGRGALISAQLASLQAIPFITNNVHAWMELGRALRRWSLVFCIEEKQPRVRMPALSVDVTSTGGKRSRDWDDNARWTRWWYRMRVGYKIQILSAFNRVAPVVIRWVRFNAGTALQLAIMGLSVGVSWLH